MKKIYIIFLVGIIFLISGCNKKEQNKNLYNIQDLEVLSGNGEYLFGPDERASYSIYRKKSDEKYEKVCHTSIQANILKEHPDIEFKYIWTKSFIYIFMRHQNSVVKYDLNNCEKVEATYLVPDYNPENFRSPNINDRFALELDALGKDDKYIYYKYLDVYKKWHYMRIDLNLTKVEKINSSDVPDELNKNKD